MNKPMIIRGKNTVPGLLLCVLAWIFAIQSAQAQPWSFDPNNSPFDNYMTINAYLVLDDADVESDQFEVAAFIDGECRGTYRLDLQPWLGHNYPVFLGIWGRSSDTGKPVSIKAFDHSTQTEYEADEKPLYAYSGNLGGFNDDGEPVPLYQFTIATDPNSRVYNLAISASQNGSVGADEMSGLPGSIITLTVTPDAGYELDAISAYKTNEMATTVALSGSGNTRTLTLPAYNVTVEATFKKNADLLSVEAAATLIMNETYTVAQGYAGNEPALKAWLAASINSLPGISGTGITLTGGDISIAAFTAAVAGTKGSAAGTNGSFRFSVSLSKGNAGMTTGEKGGNIIATEYIEPAKWSVTIVQLSNGTITANPDLAEAGESITLTIAPTTGYELKTISACKTGDVATTVALGGTGLTRTFTMPAYPVTISAVFGKTQATLDAEAVALAVSLIENAACNFHQTDGNTEDAVKQLLLAQINNLLSGTGITVALADISLSNFTAAIAGTPGSPSGVSGSFSFTVDLVKGAGSATTAAKNGTIAATIYVAPDKYSITVLQTANGTVTSVADVAEAGETITLTIAPASGYELKTISAYKTGETGTTVALNGSGLTRTFTMPAYPVTVSAVFEKTQDQLDKEAVETAKAAIEGGTYRIAQATANDVTSVETWLVATLNTLFGQSHNIQFRAEASSTVGNVSVTSIIPAITGTEENPDGTDGSFIFTVTLEKGTTTLTTIGTAGVISATSYIPTGINIPQQTKSLKAYIQNGTLYVSGLTASKLWEVYSIAGIVIHREIASGDMEIWHTTPLPGRGVYIVQSGNQTVKVVY